jgi:hypothetical protein
MDPRDRADAALARARARGGFVVTPDNAISPMDTASTVQIPRWVVATADPQNDPETTVIISPIPGGPAWHPGAQQPPAPWPHPGPPHNPQPGLHPGQPYNQQPGQHPGAQQLPPPQPYPGPPQNPAPGQHTGPPHNQQPGARPGQVPHLPAQRPDGRWG